MIHFRSASSFSSFFLCISFYIIFKLLSSGYRNHDKKKSHKYDSSKYRLRKKAGGREKEGGGGTRRGGSRASSQRPSRSHSDDEEDEGVPASYHTVSLQVSQDVSTTALFTLLPFDWNPAVPLFQKHLVPPPSPPRLGLWHQDVLGEPWCWLTKGHLGRV